MKAFQKISPFFPIMFLILGCDDSESKNNSRTMNQAIGQTNADSKTKTSSEKNSSTAIELKAENTETCKPEKEKFLRSYSAKNMENTIKDSFALNSTHAFKRLPSMGARAKFSNAHLKEPLSKPFIDDFMVQSEKIAQEVFDNSELKKCEPENTDCFKKSLLEAFRVLLGRHTDEAVIQRFLKFFEKLASLEGATNQAAAIGSIQTALQSPYFIYDLSALQPENDKTITDLELAKRLALFIWQSGPDISLIRIAAKGKLKDPAELNTQVSRMLKSPKSARGIIAFYKGWLGLDSAPNAQRNLIPSREEFKKLVEAETIGFIKSKIVSSFEKKSSLMALFSDRLGGHSEKFNSLLEVSDNSKNEERYGILSHPLIHFVTSASDKPSPVTRGLYILKNFLCRDLGPPPPDAGMFAEGTDFPENASTRDRLEAHRRNPSCAGCHNQMDPLGLAMEPIDANGLLRSLDNEGQPINAAVEFQLDGKVHKIDGPKSLGILLSESPTVKRCLIKQGFHFATGYPFARNKCSDNRMNHIVKDFEKEGETYQALVRAIVLSPEFLIP